MKHTLIPAATGGGNDGGCVSVSVSKGTSMDFISHALWTNLIYNQSTLPERLLATALGVAPDALAFGPLMASRWLSGKKRVMGKVDETTYDELNRTIPRWVFRIYDITHSIPIWLVGFFLWWWLRGSVPWPAFAWLIHILVDIPTHTKRFFPTPFVWPFSSYRFDGINWGVRWFMVLNYSACIVMYCFVYFDFR
ncbi:MAG: hypothetical protein AB1644_12995 [Candidatus Zixiibacteriota bacterium]